MPLEMITHRRDTDDTFKEFLEKEAKDKEEAEKEWKELEEKKKAEENKKAEEALPIEQASGDQGDAAADSAADAANANE